MVDKITMETNIPGVFAAGDMVVPGQVQADRDRRRGSGDRGEPRGDYFDPKARLDPGHSTNIMEKREKAEAAARSAGRSTLTLPTEVDRTSGHRQVLDDGPGRFQPAVVRVVRNGAAIGQDELAAASLRQRVPRLGSDLLFRALGEGPELVPATHQALAGLDPGFAQARTGDAIGPTQTWTG